MSRSADSGDAPQKRPLSRLISRIVGDMTKTADKFGKPFGA